MEINKNLKLQIPKKFLVPDTSKVKEIFDNLKNKNFADITPIDPYEKYLLKNLQKSHNLRVHGVRAMRGKNNHLVNRLINSIMAKSWNLGKKQRASKSNRSPAKRSHSS